MPEGSHGVGRVTRAGRVFRDRHGRGGRAAVTGPFLPPLHTRVDVFESTVATTAEYLKDMWPDELDDVSFEIAALPAEEDSSAGIARWYSSAAERRIVLYRLPIERLAKPSRSDDGEHRQMLVESCVFRAVAELLGKDPWDLAPDRFRHL
jgi:hypothetical protein